MTPRFVGVSGLPRAGSTLLCQLLGEHPHIHSDGHSSPLCSAMLRLRQGISDDDFFLAQLDVDFERVYAQLAAAARGFIGGWYEHCDRDIVIDKNRGWLRNIEYLLHVEPEARLLICVRELGQIYGSIEAQHQRTILIDFADHTGGLDRYTRADTLFSKDGVIGSSLQAIEAVQDFPAAVQQRIHLVIFERLISDPLATMGEIYKFIGAEPHRFDPQKLRVRPHESDSHYRHKYPHSQRSSILEPAAHGVPMRIQSEVEKTYRWFYEHFYPGWELRAQKD